MRLATITLLAACGGAGKGGASQACLPVAPMKLLALEHGREWEPVAELRADGTIVREGKTIATIANDELRTADGKPMLTCRDRTIFVEARAMAKFDAQDQFVDADGSTLSLDADGKPHWTRQGKDILGDGARFEGAWSSAKRTALVLVIATLAGAPSF